MDRGRSDKAVYVGSNPTLCISKGGKMRYDLPDCEHTDNLRNFDILSSRTADPSPAAYEAFIVRCWVCGKGKVTEYEKGVKQ